MNNRLNSLANSLLLDRRRNVPNICYDISDAGHVTRNDLIEFEQLISKKFTRYGYSTAVFYPNKVTKLKANSDEKLLCRMSTFGDHAHVCISLIDVRMD